MNCTRTVWPTVAPSAISCRPSCLTSRNLWTTSMHSQQRSSSTTTLCTWSAHFTGGYWYSFQDWLCPVYAISRYLSSLNICMCVLFFPPSIQVKSAALDEMFHHGTTSVQRYHKALVLMEGLSRTLTEQGDIDGIEKCTWKLCDTQAITEKF